MPHRVLMVCDFFFPNTGGVEVHIFSLAQCLLARGHKVVVLTRAYGDRTGVRHMTRGLKVYYAPRLPVYAGATLPGLFGLAPLLRCILLRERITIVHGHTAFRRAPAGASGPRAAPDSSAPQLAGQRGAPARAHAGRQGACSTSCTHTARALRDYAQAVFTDHSLFGFADASRRAHCASSAASTASLAARSILTNKTLQFTLADTCEVICVRRAARRARSASLSRPPSHTSKQNTVLRAHVAPERCAPPIPIATSLLTARRAQSERDSKRGGRGALHP